MIPSHFLYCEPYAWGASVLFAKKQSEVEVINDKNELVVNFFRICKTDFKLLQWLIKQTPRSRSVFSEATFIVKHPEGYSDVKKARAFWVSVNFSYWNILWWRLWFDKTTKWNCRKIANKRLNFESYITNRLDKVDIECRDALKVIESRDSMKAFFFIDPPYISDKYVNQWHYSWFKSKDLEILLQLLEKIKWKFLLTNYASPVLDYYCKKNNRNKIELSKRSLKDWQKLETKELIIRNYDIEGEIKNKNTKWNLFDIIE